MSSQTPTQIAGIPTLHRPEFLNEIQVAKYLGVAPATVRKWRQLRKGPPAVKIGFCIRYRQSDLDAWIEAQAIVGGLQEGE